MMSQLLSPDERRAAYDRLEREAQRRAVTGTGFLHNCMAWGKPEYRAMTAEQRHRSFGFGSNPIIEISSFASAQRLTQLLNDGAADALHADYDRRKHMIFVESEVRRRNWFTSRADRARRALSRATAVGLTTRSKAERAAALQRALRAFHQIRKHSADAAKITAWLRVYGGKR